MKLAKGLAAVLVGLLIYQQAIAAPEQAFQDGKSFKGAVDPAAVAKTGAGSVTFGGQTFGVGDINSMSIQQGGNGNLAHPPEASLSGSTTLDPSAAYLKTDPSGDAAQFTSSAFGSRPIFTVNPNTDPMVLKKNTIQADPSSVTGTAGGSFTGCTPTQTTTPPVFEEKVCNISINTHPQSCQKILNVAVKIDWVPSCTAGSVIATSAAAQSCHKHNGLDDWHGFHATAVCDYSNQGFQKIAHTRLPIGEQQWGSTGCGSNPKAPNLLLMTGPAFWVPEVLTTVPQPLYSYKWGAGTKTVSYAGGCNGDNCNYTIMDEGQWKHTYPTCPTGTTDGAGYSTANTSSAPPPNSPSTPVPEASPGGCFMQKPTTWSSEGPYCSSGELYSYQMDNGGNVIGGSATCMALKSSRAPDGYIVTGPANTLNFTRAGIKKQVTETDTLDNQCAGLEASSL